MGNENHVSKSFLSFPGLVSQSPIGNCLEKKKTLIYFYKDKQ